MFVSDYVNVFYFYDWTLLHTTEHCCTLHTTEHCCKKKIYTYMYSTHKHAFIKARVIVLETFNILNIYMYSPQSHRLILLLYYQIKKILWKHKTVTTLRTRDTSHKNSIARRKTSHYYVYAHTNIPWQANNTFLARMNNHDGNVIADSKTERVPCHEKHKWYFSRKFKKCSKYISWPS